jgi:hypothetical protein
MELVDKRRIPVGKLFKRFVKHSGICIMLLGTTLFIGCGGGGGGSFDAPPTNPPPVISGNPPSSMTIGIHYSFLPVVSNSDATKVLTFSIVNKPSWAAFNTATGALTGTPGAGDVGTTTGIVISVSDGTSSTSLPAFDLTVNAFPINHQPVISGIPATSISSGAAYSFTPTAYDPDAGDILTYSIINKPAWATFNAGTGALTGTPGAADVGTTTGIVISAGDGALSASLPAFNLTVSHVTGSTGSTGGSGF